MLTRCPGTAPCCGRGHTRERACSLHQRDPTSQRAHCTRQTHGGVLQVGSRVHAGCALRHGMLSACCSHNAASLCVLKIVECHGVANTHAHCNDAHRRVLRPEAGPPLVPLVVPVPPFFVRRACTLTLVPCKPGNGIDGRTGRVPPCGDAQTFPGNPA